MRTMIIAFVATFLGCTTPPPPRPDRTEYAAPVTKQPCAATKQVVQGNSVTLAC